MKRERRLISLRRSCLTGNIIWAFQSVSEVGEDVAYWRACNKEVERVRNWPDHVRQRSEDIMAFLSSLTAELPIDAKLTPSQEAAAKRLRKMASEKPPCHMEFYDHIMEKRRRRAEDHAIRVKMREREAAEKAALELRKKEQGKQ